MRAIARTIGRPGFWPTVFLVVLAAADLLDGRRETILGLWVAIPLVAAVLSDPSTVLVYSVVSLITGALLGFYDHSYTHSLSAQTERLVAMALSGVFAVAVSRVRLRREREFRSTRLLADTVQEVLQPGVPARVGTLEVVTSYHAAAAAARVGGDFFDVRPTETSVRLVIGDVRGKGLHAIRLAAVVLGAFRERFDERLDVLDLVDDLNRSVLRESTDDEEFATALVAEVGRDCVLTFASAGHPPPLKVTTSGAQLIGCDSFGVALGLVDDRPVTKCCHCQLEPGDRVLFYTDGVIEARNESGEFFPLVEHASSLLPTGTPREGLQRLESALGAWTGGSLSDDAGLVLVEPVPIGGRPPG